MVVDVKRWWWWMLKESERRCARLIYSPRTPPNIHPFKVGHFSTNVNYGMEWNGF